MGEKTRRKEMMESCLMCTVKHVFTARAKANEIHQGYPVRYFSALGELAEAANECEKEFPKVATMIRDQRLQWEQDCDRVPNWDLLANLIAFAMQRAGKLPLHFTRHVMGLQCGMRCDSCEAAQRRREKPESMEKLAEIYGLGGSGKTETLATMILADKGIVYDSRPMRYKWSKSKRRLVPVI